MNTKHVGIFCFCFLHLFFHQCNIHFIYWYHHHHHKMMRIQICDPRWIFRNGCFLFFCLYNISLNRMFYEISNDDDDRFFTCPYILMSDTFFHFTIFFILLLLLFFFKDSLFCFFILSSIFSYVLNYARYFNGTI